MNGAVISVEGKYGIVTGTWSSLQEEGLDVVLAGDNDSTCVKEHTPSDLTTHFTGSCYVLPPETAMALGTPPILVARTCCGWDWISTQEEFLAARLNGSCAVFHTPNHDLHMRQLFDPNGELARAEDAWEAVVSAMAESCPSDCPRTPPSTTTPTPAPGRGAV